MQKPQHWLPSDIHILWDFSPAAETLKEKMDFTLTDQEIDGTLGASLHPLRRDLYLTTNISRKKLQAEQQIVRINKARQIANDAAKSEQKAKEADVPIPSPPDYQQFEQTLTQTEKACEEIIAKLKSQHKKRNELFDGYLEDLQEAADKIEALCKEKGAVVDRRDILKQTMKAVQLALWKQLEKKGK